MQIIIGNWYNCFVLKLFNSLTKKIEDFKPVRQDRVTMYTCGPTVYQFAHIGNFRSFVTADLLVRALKIQGFDLDWVMNITDVGHLTNDSLGGGDTGEDKILKTAEKEGKTVWEVALFYEENFLKDMNALNILEPSLMPRATENIDAQIELIERLEKKGYTYITNDGVYFDTSRFSSYGQLSSLDKIKEGARVDKNPQRRNPRDFALWKFSLSVVGSSIASLDDFSDVHKRQMEWDSPWGTGFPGWHIECSAMALKYLTGAFDKNGHLKNNPKMETIDIHTGGADHKEIHHPNEIAQTEAVLGGRYVNYWVHNAFMLVAGEKMSKSLNNTYTIYDLEKQGYDPLALRYLFLQTHYRQEMNFTFAALDGASQAFKRLVTEVSSWGSPGERGVLKYEREFFEAAYDDLNMPKALGVVWELVKSDSHPSVKARSILVMDEILGLRLGERSRKIELASEELPEAVENLVRERENLRKSRRFNEADRIRKKINDLGYDIEDGKGGTKARKRE